MIWFSFPLAGSKSGCRKWKGSPFHLSCVIRVPSFGIEASSTGDHSQYAEGTENIMSEVSYDDESSNASNYSGPVDLSEGARKVFTDLDQMDFAPVTAPKQVIEVLVDGKTETYEIQPAEVYGSDLSFEKLKFFKNFSIALFVLG